jgi:hypothetical protein
VCSLRRTRPRGLVFGDKNLTRDDRDTASGAAGCHCAACGSRWRSFADQAPLDRSPRNSFRPDVTRLFPEAPCRWLHPYLGRLAPSSMTVPLGIGTDAQVSQKRQGGYPSFNWKPDENGHSLSKRVFSLSRRIRTSAGVTPRPLRRCSKQRCAILLGFGLRRSRPFRDLHYVTISVWWKLTLIVEIDGAHS